MKEFVTVKQVFESLNQFEIKELNHKLKSGIGVNEKHHVTNTYLELLANYPELSANVAQQKLYKKINLVAFRKLNQRLIDRIFDVLSSHEMIDSNDDYDNRSKGIFKLERKLLLADIFRYRGLFKISNELLDQVINASICHENYELLIFSLYKKRLRVSGTDGIAHLAQIDSLIKKYHKYSILTTYVKKIYTDLVSIKSNLNRKKTVTNYSNSLKKIQTIIEKCDSYSIQYYHSLIKAQYFSLKGSNVKAADELKKFISESHSNEIFSKNKYGTVLLNIALYKRNSFQFQEAEHFLFESSKYLSRINETKIILYFQFSLLYFLMGDREKLNYYFKLLKTFSFDRIETSLKYKISLFRSVQEFINGNLIFSEEILGEIMSKKVVDHNFEFDKKLLLLMISIEFGNFDVCDKLIDAIRKNITATLVSSNRPSYLKKTFLILKQLKKVGYDFQRINIKSLELLDLNSTEFILNGDSLIPFTPWFKSKLKNVPYDHSAAMREMRKRFKAEQLEMA